MKPHKEKVRVGFRREHGSAVNIPVRSGISNNNGGEDSINFNGLAHNKLWKNIK
jgi:hypothetical protein